MEDVQLSDLFPFIHEAVSEIATLQEVSLIFESATKVRVRIDKERFLRTVALLAEQMLVKKGQLRFDSRRMNRSIEIICEGQWQDERAMANSVVEIRLFAAENYIEALGGNLTISQNGCRIELPCEAAAGT